MKKNKILIVEDEIIIAQNIAEMLEHNNFEVIDIVPSLKKAAFSYYKNKPDLVLLDIKLQNQENGIDFAREIQKTDDTPIIFVTANSDEKTVSEALSVNPYAYISKPIRERDLITAIEVALVRYEYQLKNQNNPQLQRIDELITDFSHSMMNSIVAIEHRINKCVDINKAKEHSLHERLRNMKEMIQSFNNRYKE